jgi:hypothetical protein
MPSQTLPLVAWGTADDLSAYTQSGTCGVTPSVTDPFGGTGAYTLNDTDAANISARLKSGIVTGLQIPIAVIGVFIKAGTSAESFIRFWDTTDPGTRIQMDIAWSGGVPTVTASTGTMVGTIPVGNGWYFTLAYGNIQRGNSHQLELRPATQGGVTATGTCTFYVRNTILPDLLGAPKGFSRPAHGYEVVTAPSGVRDAWKIKASDEVLQGRVAWVPTSPRSFPQIVSGWDGQNESVGVNCGVKAMLEAGWDMNLLRYVPDRSACTTYTDAYLTLPGAEWTPDLEGNADRAFAFELVSATPFTGV